MQRTLATLSALAMLTACATSRPSVASWSECARYTAESRLEAGIPAGWPTAEAVPEGVAVQVVSLGAYPPEATHDALFRTLHLVPSSNSYYVEQTGGFVGLRQLYGPVSLAGTCVASAVSAP